MPEKKDMPPSATGHRVRSDKSRPAFRAGPPRPNRSAQTQIRDVPEAVTTSWSKADEFQFAIQLLLDPHVTALEFRTSLSFSGREVPVEMFVADLDNSGRVAFDIVDERPYRDLDAEGLLLLALQSHSVRLIEIDHAAIAAEPRASNTRRLWGYREHRVPAPLRAAVDRALVSRQRLTIPSSANVVGLLNPMPVVGALVCQGIFAVDPAKPLGPNSIVARRSDPWRFPITGSSRFGRANP
jgi:hypothetical protein